MHKRLWFLLAPALLLAACDGVVTYGKMRARSPIPESLFAIATEKGAIVTEVRGNLFAMPQDRFADLVRDHLQGANYIGSPAQFTASAGDRTVEPYKVVVAFNLGVRDRHRDLCGAATEPSSNSDSAKTVVSMVFCSGSDSLSGTWGSVSRVSGPGDPKFRDLIRQTALTLVPRYRQEPDSD